MNLTLGERIMVLRNRAGYNHTTLGNLLYKEKKVIKKDLKHPNLRLQKIEAGNIQKLEPAELEALADIFNVTVEFLVDGDGEGENSSVESTESQLTLDDEFAELFPDLPEYFKLLNSTIMLDRKLCTDAFMRMSEYVKNYDSESESKKTA